MKQWYALHVSLYSYKYIYIYITGYAYWSFDTEDFSIFRRKIKIYLRPLVAFGQGSVDFLGVHVPSTGWHEFEHYLCILLTYFQDPHFWQFVRRNHGWQISMHVGNRIGAHQVFFHTLSINIKIIINRIVVFITVKRFSQGELGIRTGTSWFVYTHYSDVIMGVMASQITRLTIVYCDRWIPRTKGQ